VKESVRGSPAREIEPVKHRLELDIGASGKVPEGHKGIPLLGNQER
jgi:hypothetical protein